MNFRTHTGEIVSGEKLLIALNTVADDMAKLAKAIRIENAYASHVTENTKEKCLLDYIAYAEEIRKGENLNNFTIWQRINTVITGECVALLS